MKNPIKNVLCLLLTVVLTICLFSCETNESNKTFREPSKQIDPIYTKEYTYDSFVQTLVDEFSFEHYYTTLNPPKYPLYILDCDLVDFAGNKSVENLLDKTLIEKMQNAGFDAETIMQLFSLFENKWHSVNLLEVDDEAEGKLPLLALYFSAPFDIQDRESYKAFLNEFRDKIITVIKSNINDPASLYFEPETMEVDFYIQCKDGNHDAYIDKNTGKYTGEIYFYVEYYCKNQMGGYQRVGRWLTYDSFDIYEIVRWTNHYTTSHFSDSGWDVSMYYCGLELIGDDNDVGKDFDRIPSFLKLNMVGDN